MKLSDKGSYKLTGFSDAPLPQHTAEFGLNSAFDALVFVTDHQLHPMQAAFEQAIE